MIIILFLHLLVLWILEFYPYPELFIYPYLTAQGFLPYKQILDQHFPGLMFFPINFYSMGFDGPLAFKVLLLIIVAIQSLWIFKLTKSKLAVLTYALWQPFFEGNQIWLDTFLGLFTLPAFWLAKSKKWLWVGLILGLGVVFKQTVIPLVAFVGLIILWQKDWPGLFKYSLAAIFPSLVMLNYFQHIGVLQEFWFWTVQFNLGAYAQGGKLAPTFGQVAKLTLPSLVIGYVFIKNKSERMVIAWLFFSIIGGIARFGFIHLQPAVPFFAILFGGLHKRKYFLTLVFILTLVWMSHFYSKQKNFLGTHFYDSINLEIAKTITDATKPGETIFLLGLDPHLYALTKTFPPGKLFIFQFPWFIKIAQPALVQSLINDPPSMIIFNPKSSMDEQLLINYASDLVEYTKTNYQLTKLVHGVEVYENRH